MDTGLLVAVIVVAVLVLAWSLLRWRRTAQLRRQFGPEYERAVSAAGTSQDAGHELQDRRTRRQELEIVTLDAAARDRYLERWRLVQTQFVDSPPEATRAADRLIDAVMHERGYPMEDFEQRAADVSVDHPQVVDDYRAAHAVAEANERSEATTEDLRQALVHYRSLFEDLLEADEDTEPPTRNGTAERDAAAARDVTGTNQGRPPAASTPPSERRTTEEAR